MYTVTGLAGLGSHQIEVPLGSYGSLDEAREAAKDYIRSEYKDVYERDLPLRAIRSYDVDVFASIDEEDTGKSRGFFPAHGRKYSFVEVEDWNTGKGRKRFFN